MVELPEELRDRPVRPANQEPTATLTLDAYLRIKAELEELTTNGREQITEKIKIAREHGDLKENAEYHAAKDEQGLMELKVRKLQHMLSDPEIVEAPPYLLAEHAEERAPGARTVTTASPLGSALLGAAADQEVSYDAPAGTVRYVVVGFEPFPG